VRKIISIVLALGMILALSTMAVPVGAQPCATVAVVPACAGASATYTITFNAPVSLTPGNDRLSFDFGAGTTFGTFVAGDITVNAVNVDLTTVVKSGSHIDFVVPGAALIVAGTPMTIVIAKVVNPGVAGTYSLGLDYQLVCCAPVDFCSVDYTIIPAVSSYGFHWDSNPTYPGVAVDFVPPFKVCGQDDFPGLDLGGGKWGNAVNFTLSPTVIGCAGPCASALDLIFTATGPTGANVTISFNGTLYYPVLGTPLDLGSITLGFNTTLVWEAFIHFDTVGDFEICLEAICPPGSPVCPACIAEEVTVAEACWDVSVYQHKTAVKIDLFRKWNLISLPLVPLESPNLIEDVLAAHPDPDMILAIYYYDQCTDTWSVWGNGQSSLDTLEDGKSYWVKVEYSHSDPLKAPGLAVPGLWVWGTPQPVPPNSPAAYPVCDGWNMVGLTGYDDGTFPALGGQILESIYFWNLTYGQLYGWDGANQAWFSAWGLNIAQLQVGEGYWISVAGDGMIYPP